MERTRDEERVLIAKLGAILSDLVAHTHALSTEGEKGKSLDQRILEVNASAKALMMHADWIREARR